MAFQQNGYITVPQAITYDDWRQYALTHGVDVDFRYQNQCWDICALLWYQYGLRLQTGPLGYAYECWTVSRDINARDPFEKIENIRDIKRGDCMVFGPRGSYYTGHIGFADEDYDGSGYINLLGQNQGQGNLHGTPSNVIRYYIGAFIGGFRNTKWRTDPEPPSPSETINSKKFPWVLYSNKLRSKI